MKKKFIIIGIVLLLIMFGVILFYPVENDLEYSQETIECIANNSILYVQLGCSHCETQEEIIGDHLDIFEIIDCFYNLKLCEEQGIAHTPTWIINDLHIKGVYDIYELKDMTGC